MYFKHVLLYFFMTKRTIWHSFWTGPDVACFVFFYRRIELKKATEIFTRMFHDPHSKVCRRFSRYNMVTLIGLPCNAFPRSRDKLHSLNRLSTDRGHILVSQDRFWCTNMLATRKYRFFKNLPFCVSHDLTAELSL